MRFNLKHLWLFSLSLITNESTLISAVSPNDGGIIVRIRKADGSIGKIAVQNQDDEAVTLSSIISPFLDGGDGSKDVKCRVGNSADVITDTNQSISSLNLKNGSLITIVPRKRTAQEDDESKKSKAATLKRYTAFDPFPDLAKSSHSAAARRARAMSRLPSKRSMSYSDISKLQGHMHNIEPQPTGPITRIYMCHVGAQKFKDSCSIMPTKKQLKKGDKKIKVVNRCAILFGTVNQERVDQSPKKSRTSLSTPLYEMEMCQVAKVQAVWEPPSQTNNDSMYDVSKLWGASSDDSANKKELDRAVKVADALGLNMIGWIYSYSENRSGEKSDKSDSSSDEDALPVWGRDVTIGARGQIDNMQRIGREDGCKFLTLAMDANAGATEAFQFSDTCVQMVAEGKLTLPEDTNKLKEMRRHVETKEPIVIDTKETTTLDSVFCLVNTAMLSHVGSFAGKSGSSPIKKKGGLTAKAKKMLLAKAEKSDSDLIAELCDFNILMALDRSMGKSEMDDVCRLVRKYSRGQRKSVEMSKQVKLMLKNVLSG